MMKKSNKIIGDNVGTEVTLPRILCILDILIVKDINNFSSFNVKVKVIINLFSDNKWNFYVKIL